MSAAASKDRGFLQKTLASSWEPGTNRKGNVLGAAWTLLLPSLEPDHVVTLGLPGPRTLGTLALRAGRVTVLCAGEDELRRAGAAIAAAKLDAVTAAPVAAAGEVGAADVAVVTSASWARRAGEDRALAALLAAAGSVFADLGRPSRRAATALRVGGAGGADAERTARDLWLAVSGGEVEMAAGLGHAAVELLRRPAAAVATGGGTKARARALAKRVVRRRVRTLEHRGVLVSADTAGAAEGAPPPAYVRAIAAGAGLSIDDCSVGLVAPPDYPSRKAILFVLGPGEQAPRYVVKLTRDPAFNDRLQNEWRILSLLEELGVGDEETLPRAAFFGHHAGLALLGETTVTGVPFRQRTTGTADCPLAWRAVAFLERLGATTADAAVASNDEIADGLRVLLDRFAAVYSSDEEERAALSGLLDRIAACAMPLPLVFQHGDPGTWNVLITADDRPAFLDWEAAEPQGMPLWDLFYFVRSHGVTVARAGGTNDSQKAFAEQFLADTPMSRALADLIDRHREQIGLAPELVEPLFFTCWMHRALKESMRLGPGELADGRYVSLLRMCLARRDAPALRRVFGDAA
jgi:hypothetical protein